MVLATMTQLQEMASLQAQLKGQVEGGNTPGEAVKHLDPSGTSPMRALQECPRPGVENPPTGAAVIEYGVPVAPVHGKLFGRGATVGAT